MFELRNSISNKFWVNFSGAKSGFVISNTSINNFWEKAVHCTDGTPTFFGNETIGNLLILLFDAGNFSERTPIRETHIGFDSQKLQNCQTKLIHSVCQQDSFSQTSVAASTDNEPLPVSNIVLCSRNSNSNFEFRIFVISRVITHNVFLIWGFEIHRRNLNYETQNSNYFRLWGLTTTLQSDRYYMDEENVRWKQLRLPALKWDSVWSCSAHRVLRVFDRGTARVSHGLSIGARVLHRGLCSALFGVPVFDTGFDDALV